MCVCERARWSDANIFNVALGQRWSLLSTGEGRKSKKKSHKKRRTTSRIRRPPYVANSTRILLLLSSSSFSPSSYYSVLYYYTHYPVTLYAHNTVHPDWFAPGPRTVTSNRVIITRYKYNYLYTVITNSTTTKYFNNIILRGVPRAKSVSFYFGKLSARTTTTTTAVTWLFNC